MRKPQVRAVISSDLVPVAESVMAETGISTHSQLVCLLIKNFCGIGRTTLWPLYPCWRSHPLTSLPQL